LDAPTHGQLVAGHKLVADDADDGGTDAPSQMMGRTAVYQLLYALDACDECASPNDDGDTDPCNVFRALESYE
jgi:hypothetical protein